MFIIPFDIDSGTGYVISTARAFPIGAAGMLDSPINTVLNEKAVTLLDGREY